MKLQCRKGIPSALRARCWPLLCGAHVCQREQPGTYQVRGGQVSHHHLPLPETLATPSPHTHLPAGLQKLVEAPGDPQWMETIGRDLHRQFPLHEMFVSPQGHGYEAGNAQGCSFCPFSEGHRGRGGACQCGGAGPDGVSWHRQQGLLQVLKAYTLYRPDLGYCQAQGPVAAVLLMHLPPEVSRLVTQEALA